MPIRLSAARYLLLLLLLAAPVAAAPPPRQLERVAPLLEQLYPELEALYLSLHRQPELSGQEAQTAARVADGLRQAGFTVTTGVGGHGVVGVLKNGVGKTLLIRSELDALPIAEQSGLPYASSVPGVMHACGHDLHMAGFVGAARLLARLQSEWRGTLLFVGQPAEETVQGARAMLKDGLLERFPKPDLALAVHDRADLPAGRVSFVAGYTMANVDSVDVTLFGRGAHGARPELAVDPVVLAARTVLALQTLISREKDPLEPAVLTVGSIHGGSKHNIIPEQVKLQLTVRSYSPTVRSQLLAGIARVAKGEALAAGAPREPLVEQVEGQAACYNDPALTQRLAARLRAELGAASVEEGRPDMVAEDFGEFAKAAQIPSVLLRTGAAAPSTLKSASGPLPSLHSATFAPDRGPAIRAGVTVLVLSALELLGRR